MRRIFSDEELEYIKNNYKNKTYKQITKELNAFNIIEKQKNRLETRLPPWGCLKQFISIIEVILRMSIQEKKRTG